MVSDILRKLHFIFPALLVGFFLSACGGSSGSDDSQGTLSTSLTDASMQDYRAIYVTVERVEVHPGGNGDEGGAWRTVAEPRETYNLLELVNGVREKLGQASLDTGHYTQMRLIIGNEPDSSLNIFSRPHPHANYVVDLDDNEIHELKVPSGPQTGLKIVNGFDIYEDQITELILDFDALRSVVIAGSSGQYLLKPTVKVLNTFDAAIVEGTVTDAPPATDPPTAPTALEALLTAQTADPSATDPADRVVIEAGTVANEDGEYSLFLSPGTYNLVAAQPGYLPACAAVDLDARTRHTENFALASDDTLPGTISGTVSLDGAPDDQHATIDFRRELTCDGGADPAMVTVKSMNIANGGHYETQLPAGNYQVVASSAGMTTQAENATVESGESTTQDISLASLP